MFRHKSLIHLPQQTGSQQRSGFAHYIKWIAIIVITGCLSMTQLPEMFAQEVSTQVGAVTKRVKKQRVINLNKSSSGSVVSGSTSTWSASALKKKSTKTTYHSGTVTSTGKILPYTGSGQCIWDMDTMMWTGMILYTGDYYSGGVEGGDWLLDTKSRSGSWSGFDSQTMRLSYPTGVVLHHNIAEQGGYMMMRHCHWMSGQIVYPTENEYLSGLIMLSGTQGLPPVFTGVWIDIVKPMPIYMGGGYSSSNKVGDTSESSDQQNNLEMSQTSAAEIRDAVHVIKSSNQFKQLIDKGSISLKRQKVIRSRDGGKPNKLEVQSIIRYESETNQAQATIDSDTVIFTAQGQELQQDGFVLQELDLTSPNQQKDLFVDDGDYIQFGTPGDHLIFTKPIMITYQSDLPDGSLVSIKVQHAGQNWSTQGLSLDPNTQCDLEGNASLPGSKTSVQGGQVVFYTCGASTFIVDDIGLNPVAIYGLRKLKSTYSGPLIRVRRSSDNTEQDIGMIADNQLNTGALMAFVGSSSGFITTWYDQSGNGRNLFQTTTTNQPRIVAGGILDIINNGKPGIRWFDTNGARLLQTAMAPFGSANELTVVLVHKEIVRQTNVVWSLANDGQGIGRIFSHIPWTDGRIYFDVGGCCNSPQRLQGVYPFALGSTNTLAYTNSVSNNTKAIYGNGNIFLSGPASSGTIVQLRVGSEGGIAINGMISEFMIFNSAISTGQIQIIQQSQATYYNISGTGYIPESPTNLTGVGGNTTVFLSWVAPVYTGGGAVIDYKVEYKLSTSTGWTTFVDGVSTNTGTTVTGLTNQLNYDFRVSAINANGMGTRSTIGVFIPIGTICIESPNALAMSGTQGTSGGVFQAQFDYFKIQDNKGVNSGYYTTLSMTSLSGPGGSVIGSGLVEWMGDVITTLSGTANPRVVVGASMSGVYAPANVVTTFIKRDTATNSNVIGEYGSRLRLRVSIPRYQHIGLYTGTITYTLYEN